MENYCPGCGKLFFKKNFYLIKNNYILNAKIECFFCECLN